MKIPDMRIIPLEGSQDISPELLMPNGKLKLLPAEHYKQYSWQNFRIFCHKFARYGIPTIELVERLNHIIDGRKAIEIGSGWGDLGFHLDIPRTDSRLQDRLEVALEYDLMQQPRIKYPSDVEGLEALEAVAKYKPQVVIGSWVTAYGDPDKVSYGCNIYGIKEKKILEQVETYILVGNLDQHGDRPICKLPHARISAPWIVSRARKPENNRIFVWNKPGITGKKGGQIIVDDIHA
jgi:hypothetical protein